MEKGETDVNQVTALLELTKVEQQNIVTFKGRALKLNTKDDAAEIVDAINNCRDLQVLELVGNTVGLEAAEHIADALKKKPELERCLWADMFTGRLRSEIPNSLRYLGDAIMEANAHLVEIDLSHNAFGADCVKALVELLKSDCAFTLQELHFNNNGLGGGGVILAETLVECHKRSLQYNKPFGLKTFVAGRNRLENPGAKALANAFQTIGTLEEIQLPQNGIQHEGIAALASAVKNSPKLRHLNLNDNTFTEEGAIPMAEGIENINSLEIINFGDCLVRTEGAKAIAKALTHSNPHLKHLILSFGEVQLEGGLKICEALCGNEALESLDLNGNQFGEDGVEELKDLAKEFKCQDVLKSLSDDEGSSTESEDESDSDSNTSSDQNVREIVNGSKHEQSSYLQDNQKYEETVKLTARNFLTSVTPFSLRVLSPTERAQLLEEVADFVSDADATANALAIVAGLLDETNLQNMFTCGDATSEELRSAVFECVDVLAADAFDKYPNTPMLVLNALLVKMGLIKSENKKYTPVRDPRHLAIILGHVCQQPYFPKFTKSLIRSIIAKENVVWESCGVLRSQLLQMLFA